MLYVWIGCIALGIVSYAISAVAAWHAEATTVECNSAEYAEYLKARREVH